MNIEEQTKTGDGLYGQMYDLVKKQLNETFNPDNFDNEVVTNHLFPEGGNITSLDKPSFTFKRYYYKGDRLYVKLPLRWGADGVPSVGTEILDWGYSLTTLIGWSEPSKDGNGLAEWKVRMRIQGVDPEAYAEERANFGSAMHYLFDKFLSGVIFKKEGFDKTVFGMLVEDNVLKRSDAIRICEKYSTHLWNTLIGLSKFVQEYNVVPLATEFIVHDPEFYAGTPLDMLCYVDLPVKVKVEVPTGEVYKIGDKKGQSKTKERTFVVPKRQLAIVDFKSGSSGFWNSYYHQLNWGAEMLEKTYGIKADVLINYAPNKDMGMGYKTKIQQNNENLDRQLPLIKMVAREQLYQKFKNGIDLFNDDFEAYKELSVKSLTPKTQYEGYRIEGGKVVLEGVDYSFDIKDVVENVVVDSQDDI